MQNNMNFILFTAVRQHHYSVSVPYISPSLPLFFKSFTGESEGGFLWWCNTSISFFSLFCVEVSRLPGGVYIWLLWSAPCHHNLSWLHPKKTGRDDSSTQSHSCQHRSRDMVSVKAAAMAIALLTFCVLGANTTSAGTHCSGFSPQIKCISLSFTFLFSNRIIFSLD